jgi:hypothetical protein
VRRFVHSAPFVLSELHFINFALIYAFSFESRVMNSHTAFLFLLALFQFHYQLSGVFKSLEFVHHLMLTPVFLLFYFLYINITTKTERKAQKAPKESEEAEE